jgi:hypothetical protein
VPATYRRQPPLPSQVPSRPQVAGVLALHSAGSLGTAPAGTKAQSPSALGRLQALQVSLQAEVQHTPSTQNPDRHSALQEHASLLPLLGGPASPKQAGLMAASPARRSFLASPARTSFDPPSLMAKLLEGDLHDPVSATKRPTAATSSHGRSKMQARVESLRSPIKPDQPALYLYSLSNAELGRCSGSRKANLRGRTGVLRRADAVLIAVVAALSLADAAGIGGLRIADLSADPRDPGVRTEAGPAQHALA